MTFTDHIHKIVRLQCLIRSQDEKPIKVKLQKPLNDWNKNLTFLSARITKKFQFLAQISDDQWTLSLNGVIVDKNDPHHFGEIISRIPPIPTIDIVRCPVQYEIARVVYLCDDTNSNISIMIQKSNQ